MIDAETPYSYHETLVRPRIVAKEIQVVAPPEPKYKYTYYADSEVYFDPEANQYLWLDDGAWRVSNSLPTTITIDPTTGKPIEMATDVRLMIAP